MDFTGNREYDLGHHLAAGRYWLEKVAPPRGAIAISYCAFEFRLEIERLAFQYWLQVHKGEYTEEQLLHDIRAFKRLEKKVYDLGGKQDEINRYFELVRIFFETLELPCDFVTPNVGKLNKYWQACSEYCHVGWSLLWEDEGAVIAARAELGEISSYLDSQIQGLIGWPDLPVSKYEEKNQVIRDYIEGKSTKEQVVAFVKQQGLWGRIEYADGRPAKFAGKAVHPSSASSPDNRNIGG
ncbi:hypothetical protein [Pseudomonas sp.]|uniref:hypothetical protein n=1 Tax=Pseudomonas sp. TaxID=306 RepID=UPI0027336FD1|nr:hypothetical protein [Pseudomonas sp.]MDP3814206.1 hypothetical protein [Pseudomonas sp.]